jgi:PAS domain S-box-containing protein
MAVAAPPKEREHLQQIIAEITQGVILVDPDKSISWANKAALQMHQVSAVEDLGHTSEEYAKRFLLKYRNHHELDAEDYPLERAAHHESFSEVIVELFRRQGGDGEPLSIHSTGSLQVTDPEGSAAFYAVVLTNISDQIEAEDNFEAAFRANPAPALICRLSDLRFIKVNSGFIQMTRWPREQVIGRSVYELDVFNGSNRREASIALLHEAETIPQSEARLPVPNGQEHHVIVAGQPIEVADEPCMLFTFADLEDRKAAESELQHSEERFSISFKLSPVAQIITSADGFKVLEANEQFLRMTELSASEVAGRDLRDVRMWGEEEKLLDALGPGLKRTGEVQGLEIRLETKTGRTIDTLFSAHAVRINQEPCVLCSFQDITDRKRSEVELIEAIDAVMKESWFGRTVAEKLAAFRTASQGKILPPVQSLTRREREILVCICKGTNDQGIAEKLSISRNTVRNHMASLYKKIGVNRRADAVLWARDAGIK